MEEVKERIKRDDLKSSLVKVKDVSFCFFPLLLQVSEHFLLRTIFRVYFESWIGEKRWIKEGRERCVHTIGWRREKKKKMQLPVTINSRRWFFLRSSVRNFPILAFYFIRFLFHLLSYHAEY